MSRLLAVSSLLSPPELGRFSDSEPPTKKLRVSWPSPGCLAMEGFKQSSAVERLIAPISPPVSPQKLLEEKEDKASLDSNSGGIDTKDPILFPGDAQRARNSQVDTYRPLFNPTDEDVRQAITAHVASRQVPNPTAGRKPPSTTIPTCDEYKLVLSCLSNRSKIGALYRRDPRAYFEWVMKNNEEHYNLAKGIRISQSGITQAQPSTKATVPRKAVNYPLSHHGTRGGYQLTSRAARTRPMTPNSRAMSQTHRISEPGLLHDDKTMNKRKEDVDFESLPDYSPPVSPLLDPKALRVDWPGNSLDLSQDPHRHLLPEAEISLASALRLSCATYLCSKRRIFMGRLETIKNGKDFRKTDAQQACKIDVNKASRLWTAYEKAGWLDPSYFQKFLAVS